MHTRLSRVLLCALFLLWIGGLLLALLLLPDRTFSEMENRVLSTFPDFTADAFFSGDFGADFEVYLNDQFPLRDGWQQLSVLNKQALLQRHIGDAFLVGDRLLPATTTDNEARLSQNIAALQTLSQSGLPFYTALIPDAAAVLDDLLPYGAPVADQLDAIAQAYDALGGVGCVDIAGALAAHPDPAQLFYNTDHHWTSLGAYVAYVAIMEEMGLSPLPLEDFAPETVSDDFFGTLYSHAPAPWLRPDTIETYAPDLGTTVTAYDATNAYPLALYNPENLDQKDQYTFFLGGNQPRIVLQTPASDAPKLLILRDSYTDSLVPYLQTHFSEIHLIDVRYYLQPIDTYLQEHDIDTVLAAYSVAQFIGPINLQVVTPR